MTKAEAASSAMPGQQSSAAFARAAGFAGAVAAAAMAFVGTSRYGIAVASDGLAYVSAAEGLLSGRGFVLSDGRPFAGWVPLYPLALAAFGIVGIDVVTAARLFSVLSFAGIAAATALWLHRARVGHAELLFGVTSVVVSVPLLDAWRSSWSELLFILLVLATLAALERHLREGTWGAVVVASFAAGLACLTRYAGVG
ncbi:MAG: hypothetical protein M3365_00180, partial [Gemmatimonadota bacterium]|nr:hypothetical protein [Gemmatimonadota bacterium]